MLSFYIPLLFGRIFGNEILKKVWEWPAGKPVIMSVLSAASWKVFEVRKNLTFIEYNLRNDFTEKKSLSNFGFWFNRHHINQSFRVF